MWPGASHLAYQKLAHAEDVDENPAGKNADALRLGLVALWAFQAFETAGLAPLFKDAHTQRLFEQSCPSKIGARLSLLVWSLIPLLSHHCAMSPSAPPIEKLQ